MVKWEYCEVINCEGHVRIHYLTEGGNGWDSHEVAQRNTHNMAVVLARLGREGWEVIDIRSDWPGYTSYGARSRAFLKRPLLSSA